MVRSVAGSTVLPPELIDYIVTTTDGVPLFIQEVTKNALESDLLCGEGDGQVVIDRLHSLAIRTTLQDLKGLKLLVALDATREKGWLAVASHIRAFGEESRNGFSEMSRQVRASLAQQVSGYFQDGDDPPLFVWVHRTGYIPDMQVVQAKVCAAAHGRIASRKDGLTLSAMALSPPRDRC